MRIKNFSIPFLFSLFILSSCQEGVSPCGDGIVEAGEQCDGEMMSATMPFSCPFGMVVSLENPRCNAACMVDLASVCVPSICGNGVLESGEECDGTDFSSYIHLTCAHGSPDFSKLSCESCRLVDNGACPSASTCGNGQLEDHEPCDDSLIQERFKICPANYRLVENPVFTCNDCTSIELTAACAPESEHPISLCGDDVLSGGEVCDGILFDKDKKVCPEGFVLADESKFMCKECKSVDSSQACTPISTTPPLLFSEAVPAVSNDLDAVAMEIANIGNHTVDLSSCTMEMIDNDGYPLSESSLKGELQAKETAVLCIKDASNTSFDGVCSQVIEKPNFKKVGAFLLRCGSEIIDTFRFSSFYVGVNYGLSYSLRRCSATQEPEIGTIDVSWLHFSHTTHAPNYNLGHHCNLSDKVVESCSITADKSSITNNNDKVQLTIDLKIPSLTDISSGVDEDSGLLIHFMFPALSGNQADSETFRVQPAEGDKSWENSEGIDHYTATFETSDLYIGFLPSESGSYLIDGRVSVDNGEHYVTCGPQGIVSNPTHYSPDGSRHLLEVSLSE